MGDLLFYLACPVSPTDDETIESNLKRGLECLAWLNRNGFKTIAPWIELCYALDDNDTIDREIGMAVDIVALKRCDGIIMVGPRISSGMAAERDIMIGLDRVVHDCTGPDWRERLRWLVEEEDV